MENMELWNKVSKSKSKQLKKVSLGNRTFSTIDAYSQIKEATEVWGPMGSKWGVKDVSYASIGEYCLYTATLFYPDGQIPIESDIEVIFRSGKRQGQYNGDWSKKAATDALTKGLSKLGFNADVFMGLWDDNKYVQQMHAEERSEAQRNQDHMREQGKANGLAMVTDEQLRTLVRIQGAFRVAKRNSDADYIKGIIEAGNLTYDKAEEMIYRADAQVEGMQQHEANITDS